MLAEALVFTQIATGIALYSEHETNKAQTEQLNKVTTQLNEVTHRIDKMTTAINNNSKVLEVIAKDK